MEDISKIKWLNCRGIVHPKKCPKCGEKELDLLVADETIYGYAKYSVSYCSNCNYLDDVKEYKENEIF